jgi:hypothetical protein
VGWGLAERGCRDEAWLERVERWSVREERCEMMVDWTVKSKGREDELERSNGALVLIASGGATVD